LAFRDSHLFIFIVDTRGVICYCVEYNLNYTNGEIKLGISTHYYTVYGVKIDKYDNKLSEVLYEEEDRYSLFEDGTLPEDFGLIMDGMGGKYMVFGKILFDSGDLRYNDFKDTFVEVNLDKLYDYRKDYIRRFSEHFPEFDHYLEEDWKLITFMHLS